MKTTLYGSRQERRYLQGVLGDQFEEAGVSNIDFDYLEKNGLSLHQLSHLDLSVARTDLKISARGTFVVFLNMTSGGTLSVSFNKPKENIPFDDVQQWESPFYQIFLTNTAQAGVSCDMLIMRNGRYNPYYRTKAIAPTITSATCVAKSVLVAAGGTLMSASNLLRRQVFIHNTDFANTIYVGTSNAVTIATGLPVPPQTQMKFDEPYYTGDIYAIAEVANVNARVWVNIE